MKKLTLAFLQFVLIFSFLEVAVSATSNQEVERLITEQKYSAALDLVRAEISRTKKAQDEMAWARLVLKEAQLQMGLHGYETAVRDLKKREWPDKMLAESMVNLAYGNALRTYFSSYSWEIRKRERVESKGEVDLKSWTADQIYGEAYSAFSKVWERRTKLGSYKRNELPELIQANTHPVEIRGTLRDSVTYLTAELFSDSSGWTPEQSNEKYLLDYKRLLSGEDSISLTDAKVHPLRKVSYVLHDLEKWHKSKNEDGAALEARLERVRLLRSNFSDKDSQAQTRKFLEKAIGDYAEVQWVTMAYGTLAEFLADGEAPNAKIEALAIANKGDKLFPKSHGAAKCRDIAKEIQRAEYSFTGMNVDGPGKRSLVVNYRNIRQITFKSYPFDLEKFLAGQKDYNLRPQFRDLAKIVNLQKPAHEWSEDLPETKDYRHHQYFTTPPAHAPGFYVVITTEAKTSIQLGTQIFFGDLVMTTQANYQDSEIRVEMTSGRTGSALSGVDVYLYKTDYQKGHSIIDEKRTNAEGLVTFNRKSVLNILKGGGENYFLVAKQGEHIVASQSPFALYNYGQSPNLVNDAFIYTDRSIYRPGQKIHWKLVAYKGNRDKADFTVDKNADTTVFLRDANSEVVAKAVVKTNSHGSASGEFVIPQGKLLGQWYLTSTHQGSSYIKVEEYKRPTFEVTISEKNENMRLNHPATISGETKYYFGLPVANGKVRWSIERRVNLPWWCFWGSWDWGGMTSAQVVDNGFATIKADGTFNVTFTPKGDERLKSDIPDLTYSYAIKVDVTDEGGETRSQESSYTIGFAAVKATIQSPLKFYAEGVTPSLKILRTDLNGRESKGKGTWKLYSLIQPTETISPAELPLPAEIRKIAEREFKHPDDMKQSRWSFQYSVDQAMREWKEGKLISSGNLSEDEHTPKLTVLKAGAYRLSYETKDSFGATAEASKDFWVADKDEAIKLPGIFLVEKNSVEVGDKIKILAASGFSKQRMVLETFRASKLLKRQILQSGTHLIELPVTEADRGGLGFTLRLIHDHQEIKFHEGVLVPWSNKELKIEFATFRDKIRPGSKEKWSVKLTGPSKGKLQKAHEVLAYMYDRSLDAFTAHVPPAPINIFPTSTGVQYPNTELGAGQPFYLQGYFHPAGNEFSGFNQDQFVFYPNYGVGGMGMRGRGGMLMAKGGVAMESMAMADMAADSAPASAAPALLKRKDANSIQGDKEGRAEKQIASASSGTDKKSPVEVRSNFAESAFWKPHLTADQNGEIKFEFDVPDSVTAWNVWVHGVTDDLVSGSLKKETKTVKELMVRPYLPRFFREGDEAFIKVVVNNASEKEMSGELEFNIRDQDTQKLMNSEFKLNESDLKRSFKVKAKSSSSLTFKVTAPSKPGLVAVNVTARSGNLSDGELRPLPILPGRFHLAQSKFITLRNKDQRQMTFEDLLKNDDPSRVNQQLVVTLDAQLFYSVLTALPYLVKYPYESTEQILNSFLSTGIVTSVFDEFPEVKKMAAEFSKRKTQLETWNEPDPNRKMALEETPWLQESRGGSRTEDELVNVLNPKQAEEWRKSSLRKLEQAQTSLGGFPWFSGGPPSPGVTLYILYGFSKALEFKVEVPKDMVVQAWSYMHRHYIEDLVKDVMAHDCCAEIITFMNYVLSSYPDDSWTGGVFTADEKKKMLEFSFKHWKNHSPYMKGYLTLTLLRSKREKDAKLVWESVMDSAKTTQDEGTHWMQEDRSWLWYNDTVETHAMALRTGSEVGTPEKTLDGIVQWIFLNKKLNHWKSTRATSEVIYSLSHYLRKTKQLGVKENVAVKLGGQSHSFEFDPAKYTGKKNQIIIPAEKIDAKLMPITVEKTSPGHLFASATWHYSTEKLPTEGRGDFFKISRTYFKRTKEKGGAKLLPIDEGTTINVGDEVEVQISLTTKHQAEYVHLRDPRASGFEPADNTSKHKWDLGIVWYEEIRDSATNFFFEQLPQGQYTFKYRIRAATAGKFKTSPATVQPLYAPEFVGFSSGTTLKVEKME